MAFGYPCRRGLLSWLAMGLMGHGASAATPVAVQLVLAVDVSGSVSQDRFELQREGYAAAFRSVAVLQAIRSTSTGSIAVAMMQWTGPALHVVTVDWSLIDSAASAERFAAAIQAAPRVLYSGGTSISGAIDYAVGMLARAPYRGQRQVIDVSGDGANNRGRPAEDARDEAVDAGIAINGLPILTLEPDLADYYRQNVIGGAGAFVIPVHRYEEFAAAVRTKLVTEIAGKGSGEHAVDVGLAEVRRSGRGGLLGRHVVHHARQHGLDLLQVLDRAANPLAGEVLEGAGLEDRVDLLRHRRQRGRIASRLQPATDGFRCLHDLVGGVLGGVHNRLQLDAAVVGRRRRLGDDMGDLFVDTRQLGGQVDLAVVDQLHGGVDLHAQLGNAPVEETAEIVDLRVDAGAHQLLEALGRG
jgi:Protein of unknown function (DUF1194)